MPRASAPSTFESGERVLESGIYLAIHDRHRMPHEITAIEGERFPACRHCGTRVRFELLHPATHVQGDRDFGPDSGRKPSKLRRHGSLPPKS